LEALRGVVDYRLLLIEVLESVSLSLKDVIKILHCTVSVLIASAIVIILLLQ
jgi:hypothetical protein